MGSAAQRRNTVSSRADSQAALRSYRITSSFSLFDPLPKARCARECLALHSDQAGFGIEVSKATRIARDDGLSVAPCANDDVGVRDILRAAGGEQHPDPRCVTRVERFDTGRRLAN
jgi:hypothetical protein